MASFPYFKGEKKRKEKRENTHSKVDSIHGRISDILFSSEKKGKERKKNGRGGGRMGKQPPWTKKPITGKGRVEGETEESRSNVGKKKGGGEKRKKRRALELLS